MRGMRLPLLWCLTVFALGAQADEKVRIHDLAYGEALFHFYQQDYLAAGVRLMVARARDELLANRDDGELLLGGLQLSYGMYHAATVTLEQVLATKASPSTRNRAWYFLARLAYRRGNWDEARSALSRIGGELPKELEAQTALLKGLVALADNAPQEAVAALSVQTENESFAPYLAYNRGVALLRNGRRPEAIAMLDRLGETETKTTEQQAVQDRANLAVAFAELQSGHVVEALGYFQRVRLRAGDARLALLGAGWAAAENSDYPLALKWWRELIQRSPRDAPVLEALFAAPFAYVQMGDSARAAYHYEAAIETYLQERDALETSITEVRSARFLDARLSQHTNDPLSTAPELQRLGLPEMIASHAFQESWKNLRDLAQLERNLIRWNSNLDAFDTMLAAREARFLKVVPTIEQRLAQLDVQRLRDEAQRLKSSLLTVRYTGDAWQLATAEQRALRKELRLLKERIARIASTDQRDAILVRTRRLEGILYWQVHAAFPARVWETTKRERELQAELVTLDEHLNVLSNARRFADDRVGDLASRINANRKRVAVLLPRVQLALGRQKKHLVQLTLQALDERRAYLESYLLQARYALAQIYDKAQNEVDKP